MTDNDSATSTTLSVQEKPPSPAEEAARAVRMRIDMLGLDKLDEVVKELEVTQALLGSMSWWQEARRLCGEVLAGARKEAQAVLEAREAREREHELEMARIRSQQNVYVVQQLPNATTGMNAEGNLNVDQANVVTGAQASVVHTKNS